MQQVLKPEYSFGKWWKWNISLKVHKSWVLRPCGSFCSNSIFVENCIKLILSGFMPPIISHRDMYIAPSVAILHLILICHLNWFKEMWGCFLMSGVKILHFLKDWRKSIPIHQNYTMALKKATTHCTVRPWLSSHRLSRTWHLSGSLTYPDKGFVRIWELCLNTASSVEFMYMYHLQANVFPEYVKGKHRLHVPLQYSMYMCTCMCDSSQF